MTNYTYKDQETLKLISVSVFPIIIIKFVTAYVQGHPVNSESPPLRGVARSYLSASVGVDLHLIVQVLL